MFAQTPDPPYFTVIFSSRRTATLNTGRCFIETAQVGRADLVVSGDRHRLALGSTASVPVLTAREFLDRLGGASG